MENKQVYQLIKEKFLNVDKDAIRYQLPYLSAYLSLPEMLGDLCRETRENITSLQLQEALDAIREEVKKEPELKIKKCFAHHNGYHIEIGQGAEEEVAEMEIKKIIETFGHVSLQPERRGAIVFLENENFGLKFKMCKELFEDPSFLEKPLKGLVKIIDELKEKIIAQIIAWAKEE